MSLAARTLGSVDEAVVAGQVAVDAVPDQGAGLGRHAGWRRSWFSPAGCAWLAAGFGIVLQAAAVRTAPGDYDKGLLIYWISQIGTFAAFATLLLAVRMSERTRMLVVTLTGAVPTLLYRATDLVSYIGFDEHLHARTLRDVAGGAPLFSPNPLLEVSAYYPGLETSTALLSGLTGLPTLAVAHVVVLSCRVLLVLVIYAIAKALTHSPRTASLAVLFYACCPQFFFFNSQFAYQTMALSIGVGTVTM